MDDPPHSASARLLPYEDTRNGAYWQDLGEKLTGFEYEVYPAYNRRVASIHLILGRKSVKNQIRALDELFVLPQQQSQRLYDLYYQYATHVRFMRENKEYTLDYVRKLAGHGAKFYWIHLRKLACTRPNDAPMYRELNALILSVGVENPNARLYIDSDDGGTYPPLLAYNKLYENMMSGTQHFVFQHVVEDIEMYLKCGCNPRYGEHEFEYTGYTFKRFLINMATYVRKERRDFNTELIMSADLSTQLEMTRETREGDLFMVTREMEDALCKFLMLVRDMMKPHDITLTYWFEKHMI